MQTFCHINYTTLIDEPFSLQYNDPVTVRVKLIDEGDSEPLSVTTVGLDETVAFQYDNLSYITEELRFGD